MAIRVSHIVYVLIWFPLLLGFGYGSAQTRYINDLVQHETLVILEKLKAKGGKRVVGKGYILETADNYIDYINSKKFPAIERTKISIDKIDLIHWKSREEGIVDSRVMNKSGVTSGLIGAGIGTIAAIAVDAMGGLEKEVRKGGQIICDPDGRSQNSIFRVEECETRSVSFSYLILPPAGFALGYIIGRQLGKNLKMNNLVIMGSQGDWMEVRDQIPIVGIKHTID